MHLWNDFFLMHDLVDFFKRISVTKERHPCHPSSCIAVLPSLNFLHQSLTESPLITLSPYIWHDHRWISAALSFCLQKTNRTSDLAADENGDYRLHVYSVTTCAELSKMDLGWHFVKNCTLNCLSEEIRRGDRFIRCGNGFIFTSQ